VAAATKPAHAETDPSTWVRLGWATADRYNDRVSHPWEVDVELSEAQATGLIDEATWDRARYYGLVYGVILTHFAREVGDEALLSVGRHALTQAMG